MLNNFCGAKTERARYCISFIAVAVMLLCIYFIFPIRFETNDDSGYMYIVAGYRTGAPFVRSFFLNEILGVLLVAIYSVFPTIPCYTLLHIAFIFVSGFAICKSILKITASVSIIWGLVAFFLFYGVSCIYSTMMLQSTTTPAIMGAAACAVTYSISPNDIKRIQVYDRWLISVLLLFAFCYRRDTGYLCLVMFSLVAAYKGVLFLVDARKQKANYRFPAIKGLIATVLFTVLLIILAVTTNFVCENAFGWKDEEYHIERGRFYDYAKPTYEEAQSLYNSVGWNKELVQLVPYYFSMDKRIQVETLRVLNTGVKNSGGQKADTHQLLIAFSSFLFSAPIPLRVLSALALTMLFFFLMWLTSRRKEKLDLLFVLSMLTVLLAEMLFVALRGRYVNRAVLAVAIPAFAPIYLLCWRSAIGILTAKRNISQFVFVIYLLMLAVSGFGLANNSYTIATSPMYSTQYKMRNAYEAYAINHPENLYLFDTSLACIGDPLIVYPGSKPTNVIFWGGATMHSVSYYAQLKKNGLTELYADQLLKDKCYLLTASPEEHTFFDYMKATYGATGYEVVDQFDQIFVIKFTK